MRARRWIAMPGLLFGAVLLPACGDDEVSTSNNVSGTVNEWTASVDASRAKAGPVTFTIKNEGTIEHEFLVVKTDLAPGKIPIADDDRFSEDGVEVVDEIPEFAAGTTGTLTVDLAPGKYQLVCNIATHYGLGMHTAFEVVE